jgi:hypothetical protein
MEFNADHYWLKDQRQGKTIPVANQPVQDHNSTYREHIYSISVLFNYDKGLNRLNTHKLLGKTHTICGSCNNSRFSCWTIPLRIRA